MTTNGRDPLMLIADVNVFVYAHRANAPEHDRCRTWLTEALRGTEPFGVSGLVLAGFVRIVTNHRVYTDPTSPETAIEFCARMLAAPASVSVDPGARHWEIFAQLVLGSQARANVVPDAYLAALAIENRATFVTRDRGFLRFPGLRMLDPLAG